MPTTHERTTPQSVEGDADQPSGDHRPEQRRWLVPAVVVAVIALVAGVAVAASLLTGDSDGVAISDQVLEAWATGDQATIDEIFAEDVRAFVDTQTVADSISKLTARAPSTGCSCSRETGAAERWGLAGFQPSPWPRPANLPRHVGLT